MAQSATTVYASQVAGGKDSHIKFDEKSIFFHPDLKSYMKSYAGTHSIGFVISAEAKAALKTIPRRPDVIMVPSDATDEQRIEIERINAYNSEEYRARCKEYFAADKELRMGYEKYNSELIACLLVNGPAYQRLYPILGASTEEENYKAYWKVLDYFKCDSPKDIERFRSIIRDTTDEIGYHNMMAVKNRYVNLLRDIPTNYSRAYY
jgi:hypothetical protein